MDTRDSAGIAAAFAALALAAAAWTIGPEHPGADPALEQASLQVLEGHGAGQPLLWHDTDTGKAATIIPAAAFRNDDGRWCRDFSVVLAADGSRTRHVACRDDRGRWSRPTMADDQVAGYRR